MKNPNAAAFLAVIPICLGAFCAWTFPNFSYNLSWHCTYDRSGQEIGL
jgi:hypothetical protein